MSLRSQQTTASESIDFHQINDVDLCDKRACTCICFNSKGVSVSGCVG
jgi:hypothetical protein